MRPVLVDQHGGKREVWDDPVRGRLGFRTIFSRGTTATHTLTAGIAELGAGGWLGRHRHDPPELYHVLAGHGVAVVDGVEYRLAPGSSLFIPGDAEHGIDNSGADTLRFFYAFALDSFADVQYRFS